MRGVAHLWFRKQDDLKNFCQASDMSSQANYAGRYRNPSYQFRLSSAYRDVPNPSEIVNWLFGIPLPISGADTVFFGGLKINSSKGLVVSVNGKPGVGKTSFALAFAAVLSPLNTKCIYVSLEEDKNSLFKRLVTLIPEYLKELTIYKRSDSLKENEWFYPFEIMEHIKLPEFTEIIRKLKEDLHPHESTMKKEDSSRLPAICPSYVVIDNINELVAAYGDSPEEFINVNKFINECRTLGALVLIISSEEIPRRVNLDYLTDVSINLRQTGNEKLDEKPQRILQS